MKHLEYIAIAWEAATKKLIAEEGYPIEIKPAYRIVQDDPEKILLGLSTWVDDFKFPQNFWERLMAVQKELDSQKNEK